MNIYTKHGDGGLSDLLGDQRAAKDDIRFCVLGDLDELNSWLGLVKCVLGDSAEKEFIGQIQSRIFGASAHIAALGSGLEKDKYPFSPGFEEELEKRIDNLQSKLPGGFKFALSGVNEASSRADVARTIARRAERGLVPLSQSYALSAAVLSFVNRLSDYLYTLARTLE